MDRGKEEWLNMRSESSDWIQDDPDFDEGVLFFSFLLSIFIPFHFYLCVFIFLYFLENIFQKWRHLSFNIILDLINLIN